MTNRRLSVCKTKAVTGWLMLGLCSLAASAQTPSSAPPDGSGRELAAAIQELRTQVQELRATVADMKSDAMAYRAQTEELRKELAEMRANAVPPKASEIQQPSGIPKDNTVSQKLSSLEETTQLLESEIRSQYQTKVESASKYRVRLSGLAVLNLFSNRGYVDSLDVPSYAASSNTYGTNQAFGGLRSQNQRRNPRRFRRWLSGGRFGWCEYRPGKAAHRRRSS
jgi:outer membrane murein-binding lipoprotein Lpp